MELTYTKVGDYYIPDLTLGDQPDQLVGRYGRMRQKFLEEYHPGTYNWLVLSGKLWAHLVDIDTACQERMEVIISAMAKTGGCNLGSESGRSNGMGGPNKQYSQPGGGNHFE